MDPPLMQQGLGQADLKNPDIAWPLGASINLTRL